MRQPSKYPPCWQSLVVIALLFASAISVRAYNMRKITNNDGLTNSAVLSLLQDHEGFLWIGTCDGVNIYDGVGVHRLSDMYPQHPLSGNVIEGLMESPGSIMWIRTNHGINRLDLQSGEVKIYPEFKGHEMLRQDGLGQEFVLGENGRLYFFDTPTKEFKEIAGVAIPRDSVHEIAFVADRLVLFSRGGIYSLGLKRSGEGYVGGEMKTISSTPAQFAHRRGRDVLWVDGEGMSHRFNLSTFADDSLFSLAPLITKKGAISDITLDRDSNLFVSFEASGVIKADKALNYQVHDLGIKAGTFSLLSSDSQDVVWIGSDCQGLLTYYKGSYDVMSLPYSHFRDLIAHPVRSLMIDDNRTLWIGTKGDGLLEVDDFDHRTGSYGALRLHTSANSPLRHNMVFTTAKSSNPRWFWIGSEEGVNYYDYPSRQIKPIDDLKELRWIHGIYEESDSVVWFGSIGQGVWRVVVDLNGAAPRIKSKRQYMVDGGNFSSNYVFSMSVDDEGSPVFSNRGQGAMVFDEKGDSLRVIGLDETYYTQTVNDVFGTIKEGNSYWLATGCGLLRKTPQGEALYAGPEKGFANSTIHAMLKAGDGNIWASTNRGLVCFNPDSERGDLFDADFGVTVTEFSDGAACSDDDGCLIFGGIDGISIISPDNGYTPVNGYLPAVTLIGFEVGGRNVGLGEYYDRKDNSIVLPYDEPHFTLTFATPDFINAYKSSYFFSLDGQQWLNNHGDNSWSFTKMSPGDYKLYVKYVNLQTGLESEPLILNLRITPPWYLSTAAKIVYLLVIIGMIALIVCYFLRRQSRKQRQAFADIEAAHKEEVYEEKLKFFTNITHEFCTPLTLIYGPCERILSYEGADNYIRKYIGLIRSNTQRLNNLIQEIIDFRRIETANNRRKVRRIDVSELCNDIIESFSDMAERNNITVVNEIEPDIVWHTDYRSISKIVGNLVSNAFKYTAPGGTVKIGLERCGDSLRLSVWNTGKGIREEDKERVFNQYAILDNVEEKATKGLSARNGLGMAICHSMVEILEGRIEIDSKVGEYACFIVTLPLLEVDTETPVDRREGALPAATTETSAPAATDSSAAPAPIASPDSGAASHKAKILIVDDNEDMLALLAESLAEYDVIKATDGRDAIKMIIDSMPDLVITDVMMPGTDGLELTRQIKSNPHTMHVPLIILSARTSNEEIVEGIETGADVYISKPFSFSYLRAMIRRLLDYNSKLRDYYKSSASSYEYVGGQLLDQEARELIQKFTAYIDDNIENSDLTPDDVAEHLNMSVRNLYRKFKDMGIGSPSDFIKEHRMGVAARLLLTTTLTAQEIIYRCGYNTRAYFYKEFAKKYGMTPREYRKSNQVKDDSLSGASADGQGG